MKKLALKTALRLALPAALFATLTVSAQMPGSGSPGISTALTKLFGDVTAFSAKADVRVIDNSQNELMSLPMDFALLDNKMRVEIDATRMKNKDLPADAAENLKKMGMAKMISIIRPDKKLVYIIYPDQKSLLSMPLPKEEIEAAESKSKTARTPLGKEIIDGHPCAKTKVVVSDEKGQLLEATTWNASDLKDFPIQIQTKEKENISIIHYKDVQFARPDAKQFEPPVGYTPYTDVQELMQVMMKKMLNGGEKKSEAK